MLIAGNWKMTKGAHQAREFAAQIRRLPERLPSVDVVVCPPYVALEATIQGLGADTRARVYAQSVHWELEGAFTGEVSAPMLLELGVAGALVGHSERRELMGETDEIVAKKLRAVLAADMHPILCVGESLEQREGGETDEFVASQVRAGFASLPADKAAQCVVAYEPIWAIGTGRNATPDDANATIGVIRATLRDLVGGTADELRILYGGSMKPGNAADLMAMPEIDGPVSVRPPTCWSLS